ncbi:MAG: leucyl/phenylalanyl-tRNA--protein transferase [Aquabacterium sp.]
MATQLTWLRHPGDPFPPTRRALGPDSEAPGLLAAGGEVTPRRLEMAYRAGVFPWYSEGQPVLWWTPDPRMVLPVSEFRISRSLRRTLQRFIGAPGCEVRIDHAFDRVIEACAGSPRDGQNGTWIVPELAVGYRQWHREGRVHSFETWVDGDLVGGLYGVSIGRMFFGESMFARRDDASKIALAALVAFCRSHGIALVDCQQNTRHLASLGAREITRASFESHLAGALAAPAPADWTYDVAMWSQLGIGRSPVTAADKAVDA